MNICGIKQPFSYRVASTVSEPPVSLPNSYWAAESVHFGTTNPLNPDSARLKKHVHELTELAKKEGDSAAYIRQEWEKLGLAVQEESFSVNGHRFTNLSVSLGLNNTKPPILVSSHYDSPLTGIKRDKVLPQADYAASGIAGLLDLARLLKRQETSLPKRVILTAYANEQLPYERTRYAASKAHVEQLKARKQTVESMLSMDMIGYFSDERNSQPYPFPIKMLRVIPPLKKFFPDTGNFIAIVGNLNSLGLSHRLKESFKGTGLDAKIFAAPSLFRTNRSDHQYFAKNGTPAVMLTDTGYLRNTGHYGWNGEKDTEDTLDINRMGQIVKGVLNFVTQH